MASETTPTCGIIITSLGFVLVQLDVSIVNVALARIGADLGGGIAGLTWVVDAYTVAFASLMLSAGALADRAGPRRVFLGGFTAFVAASLICGLAPGRVALIGARALQGAGAAALVPSSLALLNHLCRDNPGLRARAVGVWTAAGSVSLAAGPILGGLIIHWFGWRAIFLLNVPVGLAGLYAAQRTIGEAETRETAFDLPGQALGILTLSAVTAAIIENKAGLALWPVAAASAIAFLITDARRAQPMLPPAFFRAHGVSPTLLVGFVANFSLYGTIFTINLFFQQRAGYTPVQAALVFLPFPLALLAANLVAGPVVARIGPRLPIAYGLMIAAAGFLLFARVPGETAWVVMQPGLILIPAGIGTVVPAMTTALLSAVRQGEAGLASGALNTVRQAGGAIGVAVFGTLFGAGDAHGMHVAFILACSLLVLTALIAVVKLPRPETYSTRYSAKAAGLGSGPQPGVSGR